MLAHGAMYRFIYIYDKYQHRVSIHLICATSRMKTRRARFITSLCGSQMSPKPWLADELRAVAHIVQPVIMQFGSQQLVREQTLRRDISVCHVMHLESATSMLRIIRATRARERTTVRQLALVCKAR